jgi:hypothetical protein
VNSRDLLRWMLVPAKGSTRRHLIPRVASGMSVPRVLHQVFFKSPPGPPPTEILQNIARIRELNPGWRYHLYDEAAMLQFIGEHYPASILELFQRIDSAYGAARADLFRYLLLYRVGGVYLDIKSSLTSPLDVVIAPGDRYLLSHWRNRAGQEFEGWGIYPELGNAPPGELQQWHIVAAPGHPFLRAVIARVLRNLALYNPALDGTGWAGVLRMTGPIAYTQAIRPILARYEHRMVDALHDLGFQYSIYPHSSAHQRLFSEHYASRTEPIVQLTSSDLAATRRILKLRAAMAQFGLSP